MTRRTLPAALLFSLAACGGDGSELPAVGTLERDRSRLSYLAEIELSGPAARDLPSGLPVEVDFPDLPPP